MRRPGALIGACLLLVVGFASAPSAGMRVKWVTSVYADADGNGLKHPEGVACTDEQLIVADTGNGRILRYRYEGPVVTAEAEYSPRNAYPVLVQLSAKGAIYYFDNRDRRILGLSATGEDLGPLKPKGVPTSAEIIPKSFRLDAEDNFYLLDLFSKRVIVLDPEGGFSRELPLPEGAGFISDLEVDRAGTVYVVDGVDAAVHSASRMAKGFTALTDRLKDYVNFPTRLTLDDRGILYLVDQHGSGLGIVGQDGGFLGRKLGLGWGEAGLYYPSQICISRSRTVFIADRNNSRIQMYVVEEK